MWTVNLPEPLSYSATAPTVSSGCAPERGQRSLRLTIWAAPAKSCLDRPEREPPLHRDVGRAALGMQHAVAGGLHRLLRVGHHRQVLVVDRDQVERVLGDVAALGHHHGDRFADVADAADGDAALLDRRVGRSTAAARSPGRRRRRSAP